ncbi:MULTISPECIES: FadR/GntR family transcriptional regulator [unclassified Nocardioides]|uniref:FadR/GntR family transcriptional regulator n=1 Tax=unclassified Nocardioides TaxID=2615069 RepID=UPI001886457D|nr:MULTISPECIES: GntR family transcriptional regulator [unclassified Nocardioides]
MSVSTDRVRVPKTAEVVAHTLRTQIVRGEIAEGEPLPSESALMERFGISRPSLREAFRILESERLIEVRRGSRGGARAIRPDIGVAARYLGVIMQFDQVELKEVFVARAYFEPLGFRLLAQAPNRAEAAAELRTILEERFDAEHLAEAYVSFFTALFARAGNRPLELLYGALTEVVGRELADAITDSTDSAASTARKVLGKALSLAEKGDGAAASEFWTKQMLQVVDSVGEHHAGKTMVEATDGY